MNNEQICRSFHRATQSARNSNQTPTKLYPIVSKRNNKRTAETLDLKFVLLPTTQDCPPEAGMSNFW